MAADNTAQWQLPAFQGNAHMDFQLLHLLGDQNCCMSAACIPMHPAQDLNSADHEGADYNLAPDTDNREQQPLYETGIQCSAMPVGSWFAV